MEALQAELQAVTNSKAMLEKELQEVITLTSTELEEYQEKVLELEDEVSYASFGFNPSNGTIYFTFMYTIFCESHGSILQLQESRCFKKRIRKLEDANKKLALELEHEKGKLAGLAQSHNALREHANILESALAKREADLVQLNLQVKICAPAHSSIAKCFAAFRPKCKNVLLGSSCSEAERGRGPTDEADGAISTACPGKGENQS